MKKGALAWTLGTWFGCGLIPIAPGTAGSIGAMPLYFLLRALGGPIAVAVGALVITFVGIWSANVIADQTNLKDPQLVVIDEVAGVLVSLVACPNDWRWAIAGLVAFRVFDSTKPWPANVLEQKLPRGWGIVLDDVGAGLWVAAIFGLLRWGGVIV
jgi:phosphatidylglycerophosphatase A